MLAREQMQDTLARLRSRLDPRVRARETWDDTRDKGTALREKGAALADDAVEFAYERPRMIAGVAGVGLLLLVRKPVTLLAERLFRSRRRPKWDMPDTDVRRINPAGATAAGQKGE
ncbi:DUF3618 domain-containing protein [Sphingomonas solaris]|uniref:DUF3618 domain-containing protein n=1 Tax=Alterirhizorhabdus solaris TaxID=2529389 RepID=A0A558QWV8_9SPHN|nr:DUF3618 domain-containing protein [Sphingomonas solaris]TVV71562.1 DUF3618 domain-containing protein [Sphingomonas solaris]